MKIYTKTGDKGKTSLFGGRRLPKDDPRIEAYGTVDELNSAIGLCRSMNTVREVDAILEEVQNDLFMLGADLATPSSSRAASPGKSQSSPGTAASSRNASSSKSDPVRRVVESDATRLEAHIDTISAQLPPLTEFVLPGGSRTAAYVHFARSVCRRAERRVVTLDQSETVGGAVIIYLNRLSDLLFTIARWVNVLSNTPETVWKKQT